MYLLYRRLVCCPEFRGVRYSGVAITQVDSKSSTVGTRHAATVRYNRGIHYLESPL